jgi:hypothetical protein
MDVEGSGCPAHECLYQYESMPNTPMGGNPGSDDDDNVSGTTLMFINENKHLWLRIALVIKYYEAVDNVAIMYHGHCHGDRSNATHAHGRGASDTHEGQRDSTCRSDQAQSGGRKHGSAPSGSSRDAAMRKEREVVMCVDLPQVPADRRPHVGKSKS